MLSRKGIVLLFGSIMILFIGILIKEYQLIVLGMSFLVFLIISSLKLPTGFQINRQTSDLKVFEGDHLDMDLLIRKKKNTKKDKQIDLSFNLIELNDILPESVVLVNNSNHKLFCLGSNKIKRLSYKILCPLRRYNTIGPVFIRVSDMCRLYYSEYALKDFYHFPVYIGYKTLKNLTLRTKAFDWNIGQNLLNIQGKSSDFYSIRNYTKQDSYREINWKATARKRKLMVNTFERETLSDCCIFIDSRYVTGHGRANDNFIEYSVRLAFGLATTIINDNNRLSLAIYGEAVKFVPPGLGRNHTAYIHELLIDTEPRGFYDFYAALLYAWPYLKPKSTVIIFTPIDYDNSLMTSLIYLQRLDMKIIIVTSSPLEFESRAIGKYTLRNKLYNAQREIQIEELEQHGVKVVSWEPDDDLDLTLKKINVASEMKEIPLNI